MDYRARVAAVGVAIMAALALASALMGNPAVASAATAAQLQAQVSAAMPSANAQVSAASSSGTLPSLVSKVDAMAMPAPGTTSVGQYALLQALQAYGTTSLDAEGVGNGDSPLALAASSSCWFQGAHIYRRMNFYEGGVKVGWAEKDHGFWCGNGTSITQNGLPGYYRQHWTPDLTPYCMVDVATTNAWDGANHSWAHGELVTHFGDYTPWTSCVTYLGNKVNVRIAANGYHDTVWDWG